MCFIADPFFFRLNKNIFSQAPNNFRDCVYSFRIWNYKEIFPFFRWLLYLYCRMTVLFDLLISTQVIKVQINCQLRFSLSQSKLLIHDSSVLSPAFISPCFFVSANTAAFYAREKLNLIMWTWEKCESVRSWFMQLSSSKFLLVLYIIFSLSG